MHCLQRLQALLASNVWKQGITSKPLQGAKGTSTKRQDT
jgi:hypothetical protein